MKILKYFLYFLAFLVIAIILIGLLNPRFTTKNELHINASPEEVWTLMSDDSKLDQWLSGLADFKILHGESMKVGSKFQLDFNQADEMITIYETVTAVEANQRFAFDVETDMFSGNNDIRLSPQGSGTKLTTENLIDGNNVFYDALFYFMKDYFQKQDLGSYQRLKELVEK